MLNSKKKICPIAKNFVTVKTSAKVLFSILIQTRESVHGRRISQSKPLLTQELKGPVKAVLSKVYPKVISKKPGIHNLISKYDVSHNCDFYDKNLMFRSATYQ